ncbi:DNA-binding transcriptional LysR family regulator [Tepidimonas ignava]|uniref:DNA-binding transcriptional LysR family regulator n=1 Tax=Tepidimonas ignava TaxID=114249 RepID=A0A4R3LJD8_9BURK|nr:DNA-binding transcriptional LysR family regulator [Tepidimonas ignava]TSE23295.1 Transcriptional activator protein NhaR [Tepidimonas ignava]
MLNYRHLYYFWMVAREGGFARAAERLDMAVQTVSVQVRELERALGHQLLRPAGRTVALTNAGRAAFARADEIFRIGSSLPQAVREAASRPALRLAVGLSDGLSKLAAHALLQPLLDAPDLHLVCHEGEPAALLAELALHRLDLVLTGQPATPLPTFAVDSERLASSPVDWYGPATLVTPDARRGFPHTLQGLPVLLPTAHSPLRPLLDRWLDEHDLSPRVAGEFEDSALMAVFAARGLGVFPASRLGLDSDGPLPGLLPLGACEGVREDIHAILSRRMRQHPLVQRLLQHAASPRNGIPKKRNRLRGRRLGGSRVTARRARSLRRRHACRRAPTSLLLLGRLFLASGLLRGLLRLVGRRRGGLLGGLHGLVSRRSGRSGGRRSGGRGLFLLATSGQSSGGQQSGQQGGLVHLRIVRVRVTGCIAFPGTAGSALG